MTTVTNFCRFLYSYIKHILSRAFSWCLLNLNMDLYMCISPVIFILTFQLKSISVKHLFKIPLFKNFILANFNSSFKQGCVISIFNLVLIVLIA